MDISKFIDSLQSTLGGSLPSILGAVGILLVGWLMAVILRAGSRKLLGAIKLNERISSNVGKTLDIQTGISTGIYYIVLLFVAMAVFNTLQLEIVSAPLQALAQKVFEFIPRLIAGGVLVLVAWFLATVVSKIVTKALAATNMDQKLGTGEGPQPVSQTLGTALYWFIILIFLPAILGAFALQGLLVPVQAMVEKFLAMIPNIVAAVVIGFVGWFVAKILRDVVGNLLATTGIDRLGENAGLRGTMGISRLVGLVVYIFVFVPALIAALNALKIDVISVPATEMLGQVMAAVPNIFAAAVILGVAYFLSRFIAQLLTNLLGGIGFDRLPQVLGLAEGFRAVVTPSQLVGKILIFFIMLFATVEASNQLGFTQVSGIVSMFIEFGGQILLGGIILAVGLWIANLAHKALSSLQGPQYGFVAGLVRVAIMVLVASMGLRAMGLADDIVNMAFGLSIGAIAVAIALSFGLGGREAAGRLMQHWVDRILGKKT